MNIGFPWVLWATFAAIVGVVIAHLLSVTEPRALRLPTARFVPERTVSAVSRASAPRDVLLLMVRVLLLSCIGFALAGFSWRGARVPVRTMLAIDAGALARGDRVAMQNAMQRAVVDFAPVAAIVLPDTTVRVAEPLNAARIVDSVLRMPRAHSPSSLAATLLRARRAAPDVADGADSVRLVLVSVERTDRTSAAIAVMRDTWPGRIERITVPVQSSAADSAVTPARVTVRSANDDVVAAAYARWPDVAAHTTLVIRDRMTASDSAAATAGAAVVVWTGGALPAAWQVITDSSEAKAFAVLAAERALVTPITRTARAPRNARALMWWPDGSAAATEESLGQGCVRWVGFDPPTGDALLSVDAHALLSTLASKCGDVDAIGATPALDSALLLHISGSGALATRTGLGVVAPRAVSPFTRWLLAAALLLLVLESVLRNRPVRANDLATAASRNSASDASARRGAAA